MPNKQEKLISEASQTPELTLQQRALLTGMYHKKKNAIIDFQVDDEGNRVHAQKISDEEIRLLIDEFRQNPKECLGYARENLFSVMRDEKLSPETKKDRLHRYLDAYFDLMIRLDHKAFPPSTAVRTGVPEYVPDGLSDMGSSDEVDPNLRGREKIRVDKKKIFAQSRGLFVDILSADLNHLSNEQLKIYMAQRVAHFVYSEMPYDQSRQPFPRSDRSIGLHESLEEKRAVCRHHALYAQVLMQAFGLTSRLLKCDLEFGGGERGGHAANLVRGEGHWYLLDTTNPDILSDGTGQIFMKAIPEKEIDLNRNNYVWQFKRNNGETWRYHSRSNMNYRIMDNAKS